MAWVVSVFCTPSHPPDISQRSIRYITVFVFEIKEKEKGEGELPSSVCMHTANTVSQPILSDH